jgi:hypothetical protein
MNLVMHIGDLSRYAVIVEYLPNYKRVKLDLQDQKDSSTPPPGRWVTARPQEPPHALFNPNGGISIQQ